MRWDKIMNELNRRMVEETKDRGNDDPLGDAFTGLRDLRWELCDGRPMAKELKILDRTEISLRELERWLVAQAPSQPSGATIPPNQGVGMGEGKKVAQDGAEEVGVDILAICSELSRRIERLERMREILYPGLVPRFNPSAHRSFEEFLDSDRLTEEMTRVKERLVRGIERRADAPAPRPSCDCPHEMRSDCATHNPHPPTTFAVCDLHHYCGPWPCPSCSPAPQPCAEPAAETSSGRESCGEGTAGGACPYCRDFAMMAGHYRVDRVLIRGLDNLWEHTDVPLNFCPVCASPLREDGELKVGPQGTVETSNPRKTGDTLGKGEG